jgi:hypothetical protein
MNIHRALHQRPALAATLFFLVAAVPLYSQNAPAAPPAAESERQTIDFEGIRIVFPKGEADVVEQLKPALRKFREQRRSAIEAEANEIAECLSGTEMIEILRKPVALFTAREAVSDRFNARWASQTATMRKIAGACRKWAGDISELQLWRPAELAPFQTRADGGSNAEGMSYRFPQVSFGDNGSRFAIHPPFLVALLGLDITLRLNEETKPIRLDIPIFYKPGESAEQIAAYGRGFLEHLPKYMHEELSRGMGLTAALPQWTFEYMSLGELEAVFVERRTAEETALADGLARFLLFVQILKQDGEEKTMKKTAQLFPFGMGGWDTSDPTAILTTLQKLDPLAKVERTQVTERIFARNLIALTLAEIARKDAAQLPILHKFKKAGVAVPPGGFTMDSFIASVDAAYEEPGFFQRALAAKKATTLEQLRRKFDLRKEQINDGASLAAKTPAAPVTVPGRQSAKFDGLTITFPPELKAAVQIIGPEYAKVLAKARKAMEALSKKAPVPVAVEVADADLAALHAYGIKPDAKLLREVAAMVGAAQDKTQFARWFVSGDRMQIWIKEDLRAFLKGGGTLPDFSVAPDGEGVTWDFQYKLSSKSLDAEKPVYPMVPKRGSMPEKLDDPAAVAAAIRAGEPHFFTSMRLADQNLEEASGKIASDLPRFGQVHTWFTVVHEVAESAIVNDTIQSADRRWFCDGLANWIAIQDVDRRFGPGKGAEAFAELYDAAELQKHAAKVDLLAWPTVEDVNNASRPEVEKPQANYYFATLVMKKACESPGADFVKSWLNEIRKTPLNRANAGTVLAAYRKLTGFDLKEMIDDVVK